MERVLSRALVGASVCDVAGLLAVEARASFPQLVAFVCLQGVDVHGIWILDGSERVVAAHLAGLCRDIRAGGCRFDIRGW